MIDCGFPVIRYSADATPRDWGQQHGESFRAAIRELVEIRTSLMREKNLGLTDKHIERLAQQQWTATQQMDADLTEELEGISEGAGISIADVVVLNNYTDFRDIQVDDQGCSLVYVNAGQGPIAGQTWDMHGSAKNYVCCIDLPDRISDGRTIAFSIVGCVGMMGYNPRGGMMGVNNINTDGAQPGAIWPAIVRHVLNQPDRSSMVETLRTAPKTSGHNYLVAQQDEAEMWEVAPGLSECVGRKSCGERGHLFHTNHCLGSEMKQRETPLALNSTTQIRFDLLAKKIDHVESFADVRDLLNDHENYPKSICSNFQTDAQDPSVTCGGAVGHLEQGNIVMWRGDQLHDDNFVSHEFRVEFAT